MLIYIPIRDKLLYCHQTKYKKLKHENFHLMRKIISWSKYKRVVFVQNRKHLHFTKKIED